MFWGSPQEAFQRMSIAVNSLFKRIRRRWPDADVQYFLAWETTRKGWPHAHLLLRAPFLPQRWLSAQWNELTNAPIVDIRQVQGASAAAAYIAKYLSKDFAAPPGFKRYRCSRHFFGVLVNPFLPSHAPVSGWVLKFVHPSIYLADLCSRGWYAVTDDLEVVVFYPPGAPPPPVAAAQAEAAVRRESGQCTSLALVSPPYSWQLELSASSSPALSGSS